MTDRIQPDLTADRELDVTLGTAAEVNRVIAGADVKAGLVQAAHSVVLAGLASRLRARPATSMPIRVGAVVVLAVEGCAMVLLAAALDGCSERDAYGPPDRKLAHAKLLVVGAACRRKECWQCGSPANVDQQLRRMKIDDQGSA